MAVSTYDILKPLLTNHLNNLESWLKKIEEESSQRQLDPEMYLGARLCPDMFDFRRQIQIACDHAKGAMARLSGSELPVYPDTEQNTTELRQRIKKTTEYLESFQRQAFEGAQDRNIQLVYPWQTYDFQGLEYLHYWVIPNFMFHVNMAYAILRHSGMNIGKTDYLGPLPTKGNGG